MIVHYNNETKQIMNNFLYSSFYYEVKHYDQNQ